MKAKDIKLAVREKYGNIARQSSLINQSSCCGTSACCGDLGISMIGEEYENVEGHHKDADLGLGCGIPTQFAAIKTGDHVLDLGSGAGNDCFVARSVTGDTGKVTGLDFTDAMIEKANINNKKLWFSNVEFIKGDIEEMPFPDNSFDIIVSNCVLNLVPDKIKAFAEMMRVLKSGAHFCVSDIVIMGELPGIFRNDLEMYAGCISGAVTRDQYMDIIHQQGFINVTIHQVRKVNIPLQVLGKYMSEEEVSEFQKDGKGIFSITVTGYKK